MPVANPDHDAKADEEDRRFYATDYAPVLHANDIRYNDEEWWVPAADTRGHSVRLTVRVMPSMARAIEVLLASRRFPYRTVEDLIRHGVWRHCHFLHQIERDVPRTGMFATEAGIEVLRDEVNDQQCRQMLEMMRANCQMFLKDGDQVSLVQTIQKVRAFIDQMPRGHWRKKFEEAWRKDALAYLGISKVKEMPLPTSVASLPKTQV